MKSSPVCVIVLAVVTVAPFANGEEPEWRQGFTSQADNNQFVSYVTDKTLAKAPIWKQQSDQPPLSPRRASSVAQSQLERTVADIKQWKLEEIALVDTGDHLHRVYVVRFRRIYPKDLVVIGAEFANIAVLMDGTAVKPTPVQP